MTSCWCLNTQRLGPAAVLVLIPQVQEDDLRAKLPQESDRVHAAAHQPIQVRPQLGSRQAGQRPAQIVQVILDLVGVVVQVGHHLVPLADSEALLQQLGLGIELGWRFADLLSPLHSTHRDSEPAPAELRQARGDLLGIGQGRAPG